MQFEVLLTVDTNRDLEDIYSYVAENDDAGKADDLLDRITAVVKSLSTYPNRVLIPRNSPN